MDQEEPISRKGMLIGLRVLAIVIFIVGSAFSAYPAWVRESWQAGLYGEAIGAFSGRALFWYILAFYAWRHAGKYRLPR